jgi:hypothetical protein
MTDWKRDEAEDKLAAEHLSLCRVHGDTNPA